MKELHDSSVGAETDYGLDGHGSIPGMIKIFLFSTASKKSLGPTQPRSQWVRAALSAWVNRPGHEADQLMLRSSMVSLYTHSPKFLYCIVLN
jgi:hypothetical protein